MDNYATIGHNHFSFETKDDIPRDVPKLYFFKAGIRDFLDDMRRMPSNERGVYATAIFCMYEMMEGLPADDKQASMTLGIDIREWRHIKPKLIARGLLYEKPSGRISNRRFEAEIIEYVTAFKKRQEAAAERERRKREEGKIDERSTRDRRQIGDRPARNLAGLDTKPARSVSDTGVDFSKKRNDFNGGTTTDGSETEHSGDLRARDLESELESELEKKKCFGLDEPLPPPPKPKRRAADVGTRLPDDWVLAKPLGEWALANFDVSPQKVRQEAAAFKDFWLSKPGTSGRKLDWAATWRNWCRNAKGWRARTTVMQESDSLILDTPDAALADYHAEWDKARAMMGGDLDDER